MARIVIKTKCPSCNSYPSKHYSRNSKQQYHCKNCGVYFTKDSLYKNLDLDSSFDAFIRQFIKQKVKQQNIVVSLLVRKHELSRASVYRRMDRIRVLAAVMSWFSTRCYIKGDWVVSKSTIEASLIDFIIPDIAIDCVQLKNNSSNKFIVTFRSRHYFEDNFNQSFFYCTGKEFTEISFLVPSFFDQNSINTMLMPIRKMRKTI